MRRIFALLACALAWPAMAAQPIYREIKDFVVACDNGGACQALGVPQEDGGDLLLLDLRRDAGPAGGATLRLSAARRFAAGDLRVDGKATALSALPWRDVGDKDAGALELRDAGAISTFIDLVRNASAIAIGRGDATHTLSLSGFSAALLLVDATQGRLDNETAWLRRGVKPASAVAPASALPALAPLPKAPPPLSKTQASSLIATVRRQQAKLIHAEDCEAPNPDIAPDSAYPLDDDEALLLLNCLSGAYQSSSLAFRVQRDGKTAAKRIAMAAPVKVGDDSGPIDMFTNADYDPATATLSHFAKGRGVGDCGEAASWRFDGREFRLASYALLGRCSGADPGDWPTLFRSTGQAR